MDLTTCKPLWFLEDPVSGQKESHNCYVTRGSVTNAQTQSVTGKISILESRAEVRGRTFVEMHRRCLCSPSLL